jgi:hypothetical protein
MELESNFWGAGMSNTMKEAKEERENQMVDCV